MKRAQNRKALKSTLILGLAKALTFNVVAFTGQRQPGGELRFSSIKIGGNERRRISIESQMALAEQPPRRAPDKACYFSRKCLITCRRAASARRSR